MASKHKTEVPRLRVDFTYDHTAGIYYAHLENGAVIPVPRDDVGGKLENTLKLFSRAVIAILHPDQVKKKPDTSTDVNAIAQAIAMGLVQKVGVLEDDLLDF